jgi:hypothetical protein
MYVEAYSCLVIRRIHDVKWSRGGTVTGRNERVSPRFLYSYNVEFVDSRILE